MLRTARLGDEDGLARVHVDTWRTTYQGLIAQEYLDSMNYDAWATRWKTSLGDKSNVVIVVETAQRKIVGFALGGPNRERDSNREGGATYSGELYAIYIVKEYQRKGFGRLLIKTMAARLRNRGFHSMIVWMLGGNQADKFYESLGGQKLGSKEVEIAAQSHEVVAYGWLDTTDLACGVV
ncbi:FR47-like protein [Peptococcaceae bacterium CEB3]|nr:FR47-like protein [Peptococcaceae bacterium CEB3]